MVLQRGKGIFHQGASSICFVRRRMSRVPILAASSVLVVLCLTLGHADPVQKIQGTITEVGEGFLWLKPDGESSTRKFHLRWKARFVPPKLPLKGDRVLLLYKDKEEGAVIYGVNYLPDLGSPIPGEGVGQQDYTRGSSSE
jgi:hypothetical protein